MCSNVMQTSQFDNAITVRKLDRLGRLCSIIHVRAALLPFIKTSTVLSLGLAATKLKRKSGRIIKQYHKEKVSSRVSKIHQTLVSSY